jgi:Concanavalin A-like lectin/glucanases superfamily
VSSWWLDDPESSGITVSPGLPFSFTFDANAILGSGLKPEAQIWWSFSDAQTDPPVWVHLDPNRVRSFSTSRGRENELSEHDAGTATVILNNRDRAFDPTYNSSPYYPNVRPMNRMWLREQFNGVTNDVFKGYVGSYDQQWPAPGMGDAVCVVNAVDEFKVLNLAKVPVTDPPRDTYADLVLYDNPAGYWHMDNDPVTAVQDAEVGPILKLYSGAFTGLSAGAIVGMQGTKPGGYQAAAITGIAFASEDIASQSDLDFGGLSEFTAELWFAATVNPAGFRTLIYGPTDTTGNLMFYISLSTTGTLRAGIRTNNGGGTSYTADSAAITLSTWYHVVATAQGGFLRLYLNGVQVASTAYAGSFNALRTSTPTLMAFGEGADTYWYDEVAVYKYGLAAGRIGAHYTAGAARGFIVKSIDNRIEDILDAVASHAPRFLPNAERTTTAVYMRGQSPLDLIRSARSAEAGDSMFFTGKDGTLTLLVGNHRLGSPWNTTQLIFGDEGMEHGPSEYPYLDLDTDYSDAFIANIWNVTREGGLLQTASDATSISRYRDRPESLTGLPVVNDATALSIATALVAKYKEPIHRGMSLTVTTDDVNVTDEIFKREIGDRIRVIRTIPKALGWFDQVLYIQKIDVDAANDGRPWTITLAVSPL